MEGAFAGALGRRLGGRNRYGERVEDRPVLGAGPPAEELHALAEQFRERTVTLREVMATLGTRASGLTIVILALPFCSPISIPGLSVPFGAAIFLLGACFVIGRPPWLPPRLLAVELPLGEPLPWDLVDKRGVLVLRSTPPNADVQIDGRRVGFTELERPIFAGPHEVVVSRLGLSPEHLRIDIGAEQRLLLSLSLNPPGVRPTAPPVAERTGPGTSALTQTPDLDAAQRPRRSYVGLGVGIPLTLLGLGGVGLGVTSLLLDGTSPAGDTRVYNTRTLGYIEIGAGAAVAAVGVAGLVPRLGDASAVVRANAALAFGLLGDGPAVRDALAICLRDDDAQVRLGAARALRGAREVVQDAPAGRVGRARGARARGATARPCPAERKTPRPPAKWRTGRARPPGSQTPRAASA